MRDVPPLTHRSQQWLSQPDGRSGQSDLVNRFGGVSFSGSPLLIHRPHRDERFEALQFRGRSHNGSRGSHPLGNGERTIPFEIRGCDHHSCEDGIFACELLTAAGLDPGGYRMAPLIRRLPACLRALRVPSVAAAKEMLTRDPAKRELAIHALLIGTTSFFRDTAVFHYLGESLIPEMVARQPRPRVWSAACSNGLELYSVAMLLARHGALGPRQLLGSDCRSQPIAAAEKGIYPAEAALPVPRELAERYLIGGKTSVAVAPAIHASARWECCDLLKDEEPGPWDMIFCRNLAIYLEAGTVEALWRRLVATLAPGGVLVVGKAEKPRIKGLTPIGPCTYRKTSHE